MSEHPFPDEAVPIGVAVRYLRVKASWLRDEVNSGRLPGIVAGRTALVHLPTVMAILVERAKRGDKEVTR